MARQHHRGEGRYSSSSEPSAALPTQRGGPNRKPKAARALRPHRRWRRNQRRRKPARGALRAIDWASSTSRAVLSECQVIDQASERGQPRTRIGPPSRRGSRRIVARYDDPSSTSAGEETDARPSLHLSAASATREERPHELNTARHNKGYAPTASAACGCAQCKIYKRLKKYSDKGIMRAARKLICIFRNRAPRPGLRIYGNGPLRFSGAVIARRTTRGRTFRWRRDGTSSFALTLLLRGHKWYGKLSKSRARVRKRNRALRTPSP